MIVCHPGALRKCPRALIGRQAAHLRLPGELCPTRRVVRHDPTLLHSLRSTSAGGSRPARAAGIHAASPAAIDNASAGTT